MRFRTPLSPDGLPIPILLIQEATANEAPFAALLGEGNERYEVARVAHVEEAIERVRTDQFDLVLVDLPAAANAVGTVDTLVRGCNGIPVIVVAVQDNEELALATVNAGAQDYLVKARTTSANLQRSIGYAIMRTREARVRAQAERDRLALRARLESGERRFRTIVENAPHGMMIVNAQGRITLINRATESMLGYEREDLLGMSIQQLLPPSQRDTHGQHVDRFFRDPQARPMGDGREFLALRKDGQLVPVEIGLSPIDTDGEVDTLAMIVDVTERKRAETWFRRIVETSPNATLVVDREGKIVLVNQMLTASFGYGRDELLGQPVELFVPQAAREIHAAHRQGYMSNPVARPMGTGEVLYAVRKDGSRVDVEISLAPIEAMSGICTLASIIDVTERQRTQAQLERSNRDLADFAKVASHDLQEPLRKVTTFVSRLEEELEGKLSESGKTYFERITDAVDRMGDMIRDLLAYSRLDAKERSFERIDLQQTVRDVLRDLEVAVQQAGATVDVGELPTIEADPVQMRQLFQNLISNALKFTQADVSPTVRVVSSSATPVPDTEEHAQRYSIKVIDNGIGFDEQHLERIFTIFKRLHGRGQYPGTGIGLSICRRIVERHAGTITATSRPGEGATFIITLPAVQPTEDVYASRVSPTSDRLG